MRLKYVAPHIVAVCCGCASSQVNYNALEIASTYDQLMTKQVSFNLAKTFCDPEGIPAFVKITSQTATTQNSISPSFTFPLSSQVTNILALTTAPAGLTSATTHQAQTAGKSLGISGTDQWNQTYSLSPVIDPDQLRRLRLLYQYVTRQLLVGDNAKNPERTPTKEFEALFPIIETSGSKGGGSAPETTLTITEGRRTITLKQGGTAASVSDCPVYVRRTFAPPRNGLFDGYSLAVVSPDVTFIKQPGCILCDVRDAITEFDFAVMRPFLPPGTKIGDIHVLTKNPDLRDDWLYGPDEPKEANAVPLPARVQPELYARETVYDDRGNKIGKGIYFFYQLVLFSEDASSQGTGSPASGGQSDGRKTPPLERVSIPVGGVTPLP